MSELTLYNFYSGGWSLRGRNLNCLGGWSFWGKKEAFWSFLDMPVQLNKVPKNKLLDRLFG